jgi:hypothetical protein
MLDPSASAPEVGKTPPLRLLSEMLFVGGAVSILTNCVCTAEALPAMSLA